MHGATASQIRFDAFVLDRDDERLIAPAGPIPIGRKAFQVLSVLLASRGMLVTKDELLDCVWDGVTVSESAMTSVIKELRRALGDDPRQPRFIESVYGRGYRFLAPAIEESGSATAEPTTAAPSSAAVEKPSIAVLPFSVLGGGEEPWLADGIVEEIVVALTRFHTLFVIAAQSSLNYRDAPASHADISRELGVRYLLDGSVRRAGDRVRVTARLIDAHDGKQVWADKFDDTIDDIFAVHDRIALTVAARIGSSIDDAETRREVARAAQSADATALYGRANALLRKFQPASLREAIVIVGQILTLAPTSAWGAAMGALCHAMLLNMGWSSAPAEDREKALAYVDRALETPDEDERVLGFCGAALIAAGGSIAAGTRLIDRAIEINPSYATALLWGGWTDAIAGRADRGVERLQTSLRLNPMSGIRPLLLFPLGACLLLSRRFDEAIEALGEAAQIAPNAGVLAGLTAALAHAGRLEEACATRARLETFEGALGGLALLQDERDIALVRDGLALAAATPDMQAA